MTRYAVQASGLSPTIWAGPLNSSETAFTSKTDVTNEAVLAVAELVDRHYDGGMNTKITHPTMPGMTLTILLTEDPR